MKTIFRIIQAQEPETNKVIWIELDEAEEAETNKVGGRFEPGTESSWSGNALH